MTWKLLQNISRVIPNIFQKQDHVAIHETYPRLCITWYFHQNLGLIISTSDNSDYGATFSILSSLRWEKKIKYRLKFTNLWLLWKNIVTLDHPQTVLKVIHNKKLPKNWKVQLFWSCIREVIKLQNWFQKLLNNYIKQ